MTKQFMTLRTIKATTLIFTLFTFGACSSSDTNEQRTDTQQADTQTAMPPVKKSNEEVITDGAVKVVEALTPLAQQLAANKRSKDSLRAAEKEEFWAYTIGVPFDDINALATAFGKLSAVENIAVYENSGEYTLISVGSSKEQLEDARATLKTALADAEMSNAKILIVNLASKCGKRGHIILEQSRKLKKKHPEITCYSCN